MGRVAIYAVSFLNYCIFKELFEEGFVIYYSIEIEPWASKNNIMVVL